MLPVVCAAILVLYVIRFVVTERTAATGAHPRGLGGVEAELDAARGLEDRENHLVFARGVVAEKSMVVDNMLALVNFRKYASGGADDGQKVEDADDRLAEYTEMIGRMDPEIERSMDSEKRSGEDGSPVGGPSASAPAERGLLRGPLFRYAHFVGMLALALLAAALVIFE